MGRCHIADENAGETPMTFLQWFISSVVAKQLLLEVLHVFDTRP